MAHFFGEVIGQRRAASRLGGKKSGLCTTAASWAGAVKVVLSHEDGKDFYTVSLIPWQGSGPSRVLARGVLGEEAPVERPCPLPAVPGASSSLQPLIEALELAEATLERIRRRGLGSVTGTLDVIQAALKSVKG